MTQKRVGFLSLELSWAELSYLWFSIPLSQLCGAFTT